MPWCQECRQPFVVEEATAGFGRARCGCRDIPLAGGVLFPDGGDLQDRLASAVEGGRLGEAFRLVLGSHGTKVRWLHRLGVRLTFQNFVRHRVVSDAVSAFHLRRLVRVLLPRRASKTLVAAAQWNPYIRHRFSTPSMLATTPLLGLAAERPGLVLDAPCGMGHLSFRLSRIVPPERLVCMDLSAPFVYSTRRFFVPDAGAALVHDMNRPLPLGDGTFGAVFCADAFHYVEDRAALAREFIRILRPDGVIVIAHAHNRLQHNAYTGHALSPAEYATLFEGHHVRVFPERHVLDAYLDNRPLDLTHQFSAGELDRSPALDIVAAKSPNVFRFVQPVRDQLNDAARNPRLSGLYRKRRRHGGTLFQRNVPDCLRDDFADYREVLPASVFIPDSTTAESQLRELLEKHVLVDLPDDY